MAEQLDEQTMQELADFDKKKPARRGRRARGAASSNPAAEAAEKIEAENIAPVDPHEKELEEKFGPIDDNMEKISDARLVDVSIADKMAQGLDFSGDITPEELKAAGKWLILTFEHRSELAAPDDPNAIETLTVSLNSCKLTNPDADRDNQVYEFDENKKQYNDSLVDYVFGEKYGFHTMEELYQGIDDVLDQAEDQSIPMTIYSSIFQSQSTNAYVIVYRLINRRKSGTFVNTVRWDEETYIASVNEHGKLPVKIKYIRDNNRTVNKDGKTYKFAQIDVVCEYKGQYYNAKYSYLHNQENGHFTKDPDKQYSDYSQKTKKIIEIADQLGFNVSAKATDLLEKILSVKDQDAFVKIQEAPSKYADGTPVYYARLSNKQRKSRK